LKGLLRDRNGLKSSDFFLSDDFVVVFEREVFGSESNDYFCELVGKVLGLAEFGTPKAKTFFQ
jgi:hypothetical protein